MFFRYSTMYNLVQPVHCQINNQINDVNGLKMIKSKRMCELRWNLLKVQPNDFKKDLKNIHWDHTQLQMSDQN